MVLAGYVRRLARTVRLDAIIDPAHAASDDPAVLAAHCLEAIDPTLSATIREGDMLLVRDITFPPSSSTAADEPHTTTAVLALQALGIAAVICTTAPPPLHCSGCQLRSAHHRTTCQRCRYHRWQYRAH
ncbi:MAG: hypothetical protein HC876_19965 [Chloroflexaceae bacterium]|nr:hypothetical protein [Chloroflexaceae bacterium]